jgi:hypothetical protein
MLGEKSSTVSARMIVQPPSKAVANSLEKTAVLHLAFEGSAAAANRPTAKASARSML